MPGLGTIINVAAIIAGGLIGIIFKKVIKENIQEALITVCGISTMFVGIIGVIEKSIQVSSDGTVASSGTIMMMLSLIIGSVIGELLKIESGLERLGIWLRQKTGSENDSSFVNGFVTASLTVCIGAMAVVGSIEDGIYANHTILMTKAVLDFVIIVAMAASLGKGAMFSFVSVGILQGAITALAHLLAPVMTDAAMNNLSLVGNVLIFCVGLNLVFGKKVRVGNMLPALVIAVIWALF